MKNLCVRERGRDAFVRMGMPARVSEREREREGEREKERSWLCRYLGEKKTSYLRPCELEGERECVLVLLCLVQCDQIVIFIEL